MADVAIIGGGVLGCALAAFLAEGGASVRLHERDVLGAGASGRNSGVLEHPLDDALEPLYARSLEHYAALDGFEGFGGTVMHIKVNARDLQDAGQGILEPLENRGRGRRAQNFLELEHA